MSCCELFEGRKALICISVTEKEMEAYENNEASSVIYEAGRHEPEVGDVALVHNHEKRKDFQFFGVFGEVTMISTSQECSGLTDGSALVHFRRIA